MPPAATKSKWGKISKFQILTLPQPQGHVMSVKCEQPLDELTVQVWLLYDHLNFKYCTLNVSGMELQTDKLTNGWMDRQTDDPNTRCPRQTFQAGGIKIMAWCGKLVIRNAHVDLWDPYLFLFRSLTKGNGNRTTQPLDNLAHSQKLSLYIQLYWMLVSRLENDKLFSGSDFIMFMEQK